MITERLSMDGDYAGSFRLQDGILLMGQMPPQRQKKTQDYTSSNQEELMEK